MQSTYVLLHRELFCKFLSEVASRHVDSLMRQLLKYFCTPLNDFEHYFHRCENTKTQGNRTNLTLKFPRIAYMY